MSKALRVVFTEEDTLYRLQELMLLNVSISMLANVDCQLRSTRTVLS